MGATRAFLTLIFADGTTLYVSTAELAASYLGQLVKEKGAALPSDAKPVCSSYHCSASDQFTALDNRLKSAVNAFTEANARHAAMIDSISTRLDSFQSLLLQAPMEHFEKVGDAINHITSPSRADRTSCPAHPLLPLRRRRAPTTSSACSSPGPDSSTRIIPALSCERPWSSPNGCLWESSSAAD